MLRITPMAGRPGEALLRTEGWIAGEFVALLEQAARDAWSAGRLPVLDLAGVESIDATGIALLRSWAGAAVVLRGASPFIRLVLAQHGVPCEEEVVDDR